MLAFRVPVPRQLTGNCQRAIYIQALFAPWPGLFRAMTCSRKKGISFVRKDDSLQVFVVAAAFGGAGFDLSVRRSL
ncbi:MAG: hypothetical protein A2061_01335 [Gallionellales bacterium GWA2_59_43]|nr:MAG: hypothetical protein A2061_01335 [Gallionellales bacterium GWA2_59_43]